MITGVAEVGRSLHRSTSEPDASESWTLLNDPHSKKCDFLDDMKDIAPVSNTIISWTASIHELELSADEARGFKLLDV